MVVAVVSTQILLQEREVLGPLFALFSLLCEVTEHFDVVLYPLMDGLQVQRQDAFRNRHDLDFLLKQI